jgi:hypothetical protein
MTTPDGGNREAALALAERYSAVTVSPWREAIEADIVKLLDSKDAEAQRLRAELAEANNDAGEWATRAATARAEGREALERVERERDALQAEVVRLRGRATQADGVGEALRAENAALRETLRGLKRYSDHRPNCGDSDDVGTENVWCDCGYDATVQDVDAALEATTPGRTGT